MVPLEHDLSWSQLWFDTVLILLLIAPISTLGQTIIHFATAWVTGHQKAQTNLGSPLTKRELWLGIKGVFRDIFDVLLLFTVVFGVNFRDNPIVAIVFVALTASSLVALWHGTRYLLVLRDEYWGTSRNIIPEEA